MTLVTGQTYIRAPRKTRGKYMTENRKAIKRHYKQIALVSFLLGFIFTMVYLGGKAKASSGVTSSVENPQTSVRAGSDTTPEVLPQKLTLRIEIRKYICEKFGKDCEKMIRVATCESGLNTNARNLNSGHSLDRGIFQINDKFHPTLTNEVAFSARENIDYAYKLYLKQGTNPWEASRKCWDK